MTIQKSIARSGDKIITDNGVHAIKNGQKNKQNVSIVRGDKPAWLRFTSPSGESFNRIKQIVKENQLSTVCEEAMCPNIGECWNSGTATIMLLGSVCTRACKFCAVDTGNPKKMINNEEPENAAIAVKKMGLKYVVLTSVNRDDLPDGGANHYAKAIKAIKKMNPSIFVEALTPDFQGNKKAISTLLKSGPTVFAQNVETVERLTLQVRDIRSGYKQTLSVLLHAKKNFPHIFTKTSLMLGLGETNAEIYQAMEDVLSAGVDVITFGQYLRPTKNHLPVQRYVTPEEFEAFRIRGLTIGFKEVMAGPMVRSSYRAEQFLRNRQINEKDNKINQSSRIPIMNVRVGVNI